MNESRHSQVVLLITKTLTHAFYWEGKRSQLLHIDYLIYSDIFPRAFKSFTIVFKSLK